MKKYSKQSKHSTHGDKLSSCLAKFLHKLSLAMLSKICLCVPSSASQYVVAMTSVSIVQANGDVVDVDLDSALTVADARTRCSAV